MGRVRAVVVTGAAIVLAAACGGIPSAGQVLEIERVDVRDVPPVRSDAVPPEPGASPEEIVDGFLEAMASYEVGSGTSYPTAAQFLTPEAADDWLRPERQHITVYTRASTEASGSVVTLALNVQATYDRTDGFVRAPERKEYELQLQLVDGEWRISDPPDGIVIEARAFDNDFQAYNLYFFDPDREQMVPDPVLLPRAADDIVATLLVQELLRGPSEWLSLAVETAFPPDTELSPASVRQVSGEAEISLNSEAATNSPDDRSDMVEQLAWTLGQLPRVNAFRVTAAGQPLTTEGESESVVGGEEAELPVARRALYGVTDVGVVQVDGENTVLVPGPLGDYPDIRGVVVQPQAGRAVVSDAAGGLQWAEFGDDARLTPLPADSIMVPVNWDRSGLIWALDTGEVPEPDGEESGSAEAGEDPAVPEPLPEDFSRIVVIDPDKRSISAVGISGREDGPDVERFALSPDGTRIAIVLEGDLYLGVVVRRNDKVDVHGLRPTPVVSDQVVDVGWNGIGELVVLSQDGSAVDAAQSANEDPDTEDVPVPPSFVHVVDLRTLEIESSREVDHGDSITAKFDGRRAVGTPDDGVRVFSETQSWVTVEDVRAPAYPG